VLVCRTDRQVGRGDRRDKIEIAKGGDGRQILICYGFEVIFH